MNITSHRSAVYCGSAWKAKTAAITGASIGTLGTARAQYHLRQMSISLDMPVVNQPEVMIASAAKRFGQSGQLTADDTSQLIQQLLSALMVLATAERKSAWS